MEFRHKIRERRLELGLTTDEVAKVVGVSNATISRWETGNIKNQRRDKLELLAKALRTTPAQLMGWADTSTPASSIDNILPIPPMRKIPMLGSIACGEPILASENIEEYVNMPDEVSADFALRCRGDSMVDAQINDGDTVYVRQQPTVENGQIAAVLIGNEATLKRVYYMDGGTIMLQPANSAYAPMLLTPEAGDDVRILGLAVGHYRALV